MSKWNNTIEGQRKAKLAARAKRLEEEEIAKQKLDLEEELWRAEERRKVIDHAKKLQFEVSLDSQSDSLFVMSETQDSIEFSIFLSFLFIGHRQNERIPRGSRVRRNFKRKGTSVGSKKESRKNLENG